MIPAPFFGAQAMSEEHVEGCPCSYPDVPLCSTIDKAKNMENFEIDLEQIANSLMNVMTICRLRTWEVRRTKEPIKRAFRHYEELRYRVNRVPNKRFGKENFLHDMAMEAGMNRMDSQLAYGITKRAFRAYYYGSGEGGQRLLSLMKQQHHRAECIWLHAAKRTAEIFAAYAGLMYSEENQYAECIECVYKTLYEDLQTRLVFEDPDTHVCTCGNNDLADPNPLIGPWTKHDEEVAGSASVQTKVSTRSIKTMELFFNEQHMRTSKAPSAMSLHMELTMMSMEEIMGKMEQTSNPTVPSSKTSERSGHHKRSKKKEKPKCTCPSMQSTRERLDPIITAECSQGPYICRWLPYDEDDDKPPHHCVPPPILICPPCEDEVSCDDECTCTCQICTCPPAYGDIVEEEDGEKLSSTGLEDHDTDYCCLAPFRDFPKVDSVEEEALPEEEEELCVCDCEYKRRAFPHLFTYLAPFKDVKPRVEPIVKPEEPKIPCAGISMDTCRCWNESSPSGSLNSDVFPISPYITLLSTQKPSGITIDVTVKTQHYPNPPNPGGKPTKRTTRSSVIIKRNTIAGLENDMKAAANQKPAPKPAPAPASAASPGSPAAPARAAQPAPAPPPPPPPSNPSDDEKLTKEDVLAMFGLGVRKGK